MAPIVQESDFDRAKRWGKKFLADWKAGTSGRTGRGRGAEHQSHQGDITCILAKRDCWPAHVRAMGQNTQLHRLVTGTGGNGYLYLTQISKLGNCMEAAMARSAMAMMWLMRAVNGERRVLDEEILAEIRRRFRGLRSLGPSRLSLGPRLQLVAFFVLAAAFTALVDPSFDPGWTGVTLYR